jgi:M6 family metalloprotease-like protein
MDADNPTIETHAHAHHNMGKKGHAYSMLICLLLSVFSFAFSSTVNSFFDIEVDSDTAIETPLVGLENNESWLVVLVDFESDPLENNEKQTFSTLLEEQANLYFSEAVGTSINIEINVHNEIIRSEQSLEYYGKDGLNGRDYGDSTQFMPAELSEFVVKNLDEEDWSIYDLNDDKVVDRFLIVHSTLAQEQGGGASNRIWSHFTTFQDPIMVDGYSFEHYTMSSIRHGMNGIGTILHEMMHQFGAFDLYPVHDSGYSGSWKGIGIWDIMASGNWNGGGDKPSLPTGPTMESIGQDATLDLTLEWPSTTQSPCIGPAFDIQSRSDGGARIKIQIGPEEFVWFEKRSDEGFDASLPGEGILVLLEDKTAGDAQYNAMNIDQKRPYLRVIEADGNTEQLQGINDGVFEDLFQPGDTFGEMGIQIRSHDGILVPWHVNVSIVEDVWRIEIHSLNCSPDFQIDLPDFGLTVLESTPFTIEILNSQLPVSCSGVLNGTDGRTINFSPGMEEQNNFIQGTFSTIGIIDSTATFDGVIICNDIPFDVHTTVTTVGTIPLPNEMIHEQFIDPVDVTTITIPYVGNGQGDGTFSVDLRGPITRIGTVNSPLKVNAGEGTITLEINPNGLLQPNMFVFGEVQLTSFNGEVWTIEIELQAESESAIPLLNNQSTIIGIFFAICTIWFAASYFGEKKVIDIPEDIQTDEEVHHEFN